MAEPDDVIAMPARNFLNKIARHLRSPMPEYNPSADDPTRTVVGIRPGGGAICYFTGRGATQVGISEELAARAAIAGLIEKYSILVEDVTALRRDEDDRFSYLYVMKHQQLLAQSHGQAPFFPRQDFHSIRDQYLAIISIDYYELLGLATRKYEVRVSPLETLRRGPSTYIALLTLTRPSQPDYERPFFSEKCLTPEMAKQNVAKQAVFFMLDMYDFQVFDINYDPHTSALHKSLCMQREQAYLDLKRVIKVSNPNLPRQTPISEGSGHRQLANVTTANPSVPAPVDDHTVVVAKDLALKKRRLMELDMNAPGPSESVLSTELCLATPSSSAPLGAYCDA